MLLPEKADVLVVGGGPAGSVVSTQLARRGYDVVLVDKAFHPRETVGESVLPPAWQYFDRLGVSEEIERRGFVKKAGGIVDWAGRITEIRFRDFAYKRPGLHVERADLDHLLLENSRKSGVRVFEGVRAESFRQTAADATEVAIAGGGGPVDHSITCRFMVDATGQSCLAARQTGGRGLDDDFRFVSIWGYFANSDYVGAEGVVYPFEKVRTNPPMTFVSHCGGWGWIWHIPMRESTSVGLVVAVDDYKRDVARHSSLEDYFMATCLSTRFLGRLLAKAERVNGPLRMIRDFSYLPENVAGPGYFVIGDAAGFVDPIFSIGYVIALYSGELAAWAIDRSLKQPAATETSRKLFEHQMRGRYELARTMALPGVEPAGGPQMFFDFSSKAEKELMWSAAALTTRSQNLVDSVTPGAEPMLRIRELDTLRLR
jgi:flavin-dependent dehydrogenase